MPCDAEITQYAGCATSLFKTNEIKRFLVAFKHDLKGCFGQS